MVVVRLNGRLETQDRWMREKSYLYMGCDGQGDEVRRRNDRCECTRNAATVRDVLVIQIKDNACESS